MSFKKNAAANYIGTAYSILIGIAILPLYLHYLGAEAFGLVGIFALLQAWLQIMDMGISPTLSRQAAHAKGRKNGYEEFISLLKSVEIFFLVLGFISVISIFLIDNWLATNWVKAEHISVDIVAKCMSIMGLVIAFRWFSSLYRSGITGLENQVWLNMANSVISSARFIGALALLHFVSRNIVDYFLYQLIISIIELYILKIKLYKLLPSNLNKKLRFSSVAVKKIAPFALGMAYLTGLWLLITQIDKLILSKILTLSDFGYFSLVAIIAGGITQLSAPISQALLPRMTFLLAQDREKDMLVQYRKATQIMAVIIVPVATVVAFNAENLLFTWTGDSEAAIWGAPILYWFALGNGVMALAAFQYYLQFAYGELKLHVIGTTVSALIQVPLIYFAATRFGALGAGIAWFSFRGIFFIIWSPIVHSKFAPGLHLRWLFIDIFPILLVAVFTSYFLSQLIEYSFDISRFRNLLNLLLVGMAVLLVTMLSSSVLRKHIFKIFRANYSND